MIEFITALPIWQIIRWLGMVSYILLTLGICLGMAYGLPVWTGKQKGNLYKLHNFATIAGTGIGLLHGMITVIDQYTPYNWSEVLIPFTALHAPFLTGLGTLVTYGMLLIIFTTDIRHKLKRKVWLLIHISAYPIFIMAFVHGFFQGTDSGSIGIRWIYFISIALVISMTAIRMTISPIPRKF